MRLVVDRQYFSRIIYPMLHSETRNHIICAIPIRLFKTNIQDRDGGHCPIDLNCEENNLREKKIINQRPFSESNKHRSIQTRPFLG